LRALRIDARDGLPLLRDAAGAPLGVWRAQGRGRIALWTLTDSYRLVLAGRDDLHGELWSRALATLARPQARAAFVIEGQPRPGERIALCGVAPEASVTAAGGAAMPVRVDPATGARACAAFWPRKPGWHRLHSGDRTQLFHVRAAGTGQGLHANELREATLRLAAEPRATRSVAATPAPRPGERWRWWLAWLLASAGLWWLERARRGSLQPSARVMRPPGRNSTAGEMARLEGFEPPTNGFGSHNVASARSDRRGPDATLTGDLKGLKITSLPLTATISADLNHQMRSVCGTGL
jgi:hypothetical protein